MKIRIWIKKEWKAITQLQLQLQLQLSSNRLDSTRLSKGWCYVPLRAVYKYSLLTLCSNLVGRVIVTDGRWKYFFFFFFTYVPNYLSSTYSTPVMDEVSQVPRVRKEAGIGVGVVGFWRSQGWLWVLFLKSFHSWQSRDYVLLSLRYHEVGQAG